MRLYRLALLRLPSVRPTRDGIRDAGRARARARARAVRMCAPDSGLRLRGPVRLRAPASGVSREIRLEFILYRYRMEIRATRAPPLRFKLQNQIFNVGYQNMSIKEISLIVKKVVEEEFPDLGKIPIITTKSDDNRSYHINSDKIKRILGFEPKRSIEESVRELCSFFKKNTFKNTFEDDFYFNVKRLKSLEAK